MAAEFMVGSTPGWKSPGVRRWRHAALLLLAAGLIVDCVQSPLTGPAPTSPFLAPWLWPLAAVCTVLELALALPLQNALAASLQTAGLAWLVAALGHRLGITLDVLPNTGATLPGGATPAFLAAWVALSPSFRTLARAVLQPRRGGSQFGLELLVVTSVLSGATACLIQPATPRLDWRAVLIWSALSMVLHTVNTPWLLNKRPAREPLGIGTLALPALIGIGMLRVIPGAAPREVMAAASVAMLAVLGVACRGLTSTR